MSTALAKWQIPDDMRAEMALVRDRLPYFHFNGQYGTYVDSEANKENPEEAPTTLEGTILAVTYGQVWMGKDGDGWSQKWLCRAPNKLNPPIVNEELKPEERADVLAKGAGSGCSNCPLGNWFGDAKPECKRQIKLLVILADKQIAFLTIGGNGVGNLEGFLSRNFKQKSAPWFAKTIRCGRQNQKKDGKSWWEATFAVVRDNDETMDNDLLMLRQQYLRSADHSAEPVHHDEEPKANSAAAPTSTPSTPPPSTAAKQRTFELDEYGNPIFHGGGSQQTDLF